jgi:arylsulfatase A-like enzyme
MKLATASFEAMHQRVTLINLPEFDMPLGHVDGGSIDRKVLLALMHGFDRDLASMEASYAKAGVLNRTVFVLTADHGMVAIHHQVPFTAIKSAVLRAGTTIIHGNYHSGAYIWVKDETKLPQAAANIAALSKKDRIQSVYYRQPDGSYQRVLAGGALDASVEVANQYLLQTFSGPVGPDIVVLFDEGTVGVQNGEMTWKGDHGGADWQSQHIPLLISGPGVRADHTSTFPARLIDIAPTILALAGGSKGTMRGLTLADAIKAPAAADVSAEAALRPQLQAVVQALTSESHREAARK